MLLLVIIIYTICYLCCKYYSNVFNPSRNLLPVPEGIKEITIKSGNENLCAWERIVNDGPLLLYFHGNNLNLTFRSYVVSLAKLLNLNLLLPDYRGFGKSSGYSNIESFHQDSLAIYAHAKTYGKKIILWGESLGGHAASYCLTRYKPDKLILFNTFSNLRGVSPSCYRPLFYWFPDLCNKNYLPLYMGPSLVIHSRKDSFIPFEQAELNYSFLQNPSFLEISGDHSTPDFTLDNFHKLLDFLQVDYPKEEHSLHWIEAAKKGFVVN